VNPPEDDKTPSFSGREASLSVAHSIPSSRQDLTGNGIARPPIATQNVTRDCIVADPKLSAVVHAWPDLPEAIGAGILALVKAASGNCMDVLAGEN
jgi:hypothetical protein